MYIKKNCFIRANIVKLKFIKFVGKRKIFALNITSFKQIHVFVFEIETFEKDLLDGFIILKTNFVLKLNILKTTKRI